MLARTWLTKLSSPLLDRITTSPDITSLGLLLALLFISFKILGFLRRAVVYWVRMSIRMTFWGVVIAGLSWLYGRGWDGAVEDLGGWAGALTKIGWMLFEKAREWEARQDTGPLREIFGGGAEAYQNPLRNRGR